MNRIKATEEPTPCSQETEETTQNSEVDSSPSSSCPPRSYQMHSQTTDTSMHSSQASEYEDAESGGCTFLTHILFIELPGLCILGDIV